MFRGLLDCLSRTTFANSHLLVVHGGFASWPCCSCCPSLLIPGLPASPFPRDVVDVCGQPACFPSFPLPPFCLLAQSRDCLSLFFPGLSVFLPFFPPFCVCVGGGCSLCRLPSSLLLGNWRWGFSPCLGQSLHVSWLLAWAFTRVVAHADGCEIFGGIARTVTYVLQVVAHRGACEVARAVAHGVFREVALAAALPGLLAFRVVWPLLLVPPALDNAHDGVSACVHVVFCRQAPERPSSPGVSLLPGVLGRTWWPVALDACLLVAQVAGPHRGCVPLLVGHAGSVSPTCIELLAILA